MALREQYDFESLVNEAERLVIQEMETQLQDHPDMCTCDECVLDVAAYALNHVKPYYRVSLMGTLYAHSMENTQYSRDVQKAVGEAIARIKANPSHD